MPGPYRLGTVLRVLCLMNSLVSFDEFPSFAGTLEEGLRLSSP